METFHGPAGSAAEEGFATWRRENPGGFYINCRSSSDMMLHKQSCRHLDFDKSVCLTTNKKICSAEWQELEQWAKRGGMPLRVCPDCAPRT